MALDQAWSLLLVTLAVALLPGVSRIVGLPAVVLEILCGIIMGKSFLHLEFEGQWLPFLAQLGFLLLMFQAGMEIDFSMLREKHKTRLPLHILLFICTLALAGLFAFWLGHGFFLALVLSTTSLGLVVPSLKEAGISKTRFGQAVLLAATLADFLTLFGITFYVLWFDYGLDWRFLAPVPLFLGFGLLLKLGRLWAWWHPNSAARFLGQKDSQEMGVRLSLALLFFLVAISELVHLEPVLGAFMGGAMLAFIFREKEHLENKLSGFSYGFLIPLFFINVGMEFDIANILNSSELFFIAKLLGVAVLVKILPSMLLLFQGFSLRSSFQAGILLSSRLSLIIAAAAIGLEKGFITPLIKDNIVLLAIVTCLLGPIGFKLMNRSGSDFQE